MGVRSVHCHRALFYYLSTQSITRVFYKIKRENYSEQGPEFTDKLHKSMLLMASKTLVCIPFYLRVFALVSRIYYHRPVAIVAGYENSKKTLWEKENVAWHHAYYLMPSW